MPGEVHVRAFSPSNRRTGALPAPAGSRSEIGDAQFAWRTVTVDLLGPTRPERELRNGLLAIPLGLTASIYISGPTHAQSPSQNQPQSGVPVGMRRVFYCDEVPRGAPCRNRRPDDPQYEPIPGVGSDGRALTG